MVPPACCGNSRLQASAAFAWADVGRVEVAVVFVHVDTTLPLVTYHTPFSEPNVKFDTFIIYAVHLSRVNLVSYG